MSEQGSGSDDERRDERGGLGMPDETDGERAVVLAAVAQDGGADDPGDAPSRRPPATRPDERGPEGEAPGEQDDRGEHDCAGRAPPARADVRAASPGGRRFRRSLRVG